MAQKIELGKKYKTRDGRPARVIVTDKKGNFPVVALVTSKDGLEESQFSYDATGRYLGYSQPHHIDIIEVQPEITVWMNVYKNVQTGEYMPGAYLKENAAKLPKPGQGTVARVKITFNEGQGLEDAGC